MRHFSYSDRIRYYWAQPAAQKAVAALMTRLGDTPVPETLVSQFLPLLYPDVTAGRLVATAANLVEAQVQRVLGVYDNAIR